MGMENANWFDRNKKNIKNFVAGGLATIGAMTIADKAEGQNSTQSKNVNKIEYSMPNVDSLKLSNEIKQAAHKLGYTVEIGNISKDNKGLTVTINCPTMEEGAQTIEGVNKVTEDKNGFSISRIAELTGSYITNDNTFGIDDPIIMDENGKPKQIANIEEERAKGFHYKPKEDVSEQDISKTTYAFTDKKVTRLLFYKNGEIEESEVLHEGPVTIVIMGFSPEQEAEMRKTEDKEAQVQFQKRLKEKMEIKSGKRDQYTEDPE